MVDPADVPEEEPSHGLRETGNGPTTSYEEDLLEAYFGPAQEGVYGKLGDGGDE